VSRAYIYIYASPIFQTAVIERNFQG